MKTRLFLFVTLLFISFDIIADSCNKVNSAIEDPTPAQQAGATLPEQTNHLIWQRPSISMYRVAFAGNAGSIASHEGVDYVHGDQTVAEVPIYAAADGKVVYIRDGCPQSSMFERNNTARESGAGWGNHIVVQHKGAFYTRYAHLLVNTILVNVGDSVKMGQKIAVMGNSGRSELRHLHFEIGTKTTAFDPCAMSQNFDAVYNSDPLFALPSNKVNIMSPTNNELNVSNNPYIKWEKDANTSNFTLEIATDANFNNIIQTYITKNEYQACVNLPVTTLYCRVKSDIIGTSDVHTFTTSDVESFEHCLTDGLPAGGWQRLAFNVTKGSVEHDNSWVASAIDRKKTGSFSARMGNYQSVSECWLITPVINVSTLTPSPYFWRSTTAGDWGSELKLYYIESDKDTKVKSNYIFIKTMGEGPDASWIKETVPLSPYNGKKIRLALMVENFGDPTDANAGGDNWWIDDFYLPTQFIFTNNSEFSADIKVVSFKRDNIFIVNNSGQTISQITIYDTNGRIVFTKSLLQNEKELHINTNITGSNGMYLIKINVGGKSHIYRAFVN